MNIRSKIRIYFVIIHLCLICFSGKSQSLKLGVISDIHYLSERLMDDTLAARQYVESTGRDIINVPSALDEVLTDYIKSDIDILLITGDLTKDGERESHLDLSAKLKHLTDKGIRIFVIPGNHDINVPHPVRFSKNGSVPTENISPEDFSSIYSNCGYSSAIKRDSSSLSYVADIAENTWLLAIDACLYKEYTTTTITAGRISPSTETWIMNILKEAKERNITIVSMMHHGLVEHISYQGMFFSQYLVDDYNRLAEMFADNGVKAIFTGHFHANDITRFTSSTSNEIYDIETGALCSFPYPYRFIELSPDGMLISTKNIYSTPKEAFLFEDGKELMKNIAAKQAMQKIRNRMPDLSDNTLLKLGQTASEIFILHIRGDEVVGDSLKRQIENIADELNIPIDLSPESLQLDFPPADNNLYIPFRKQNK